MKKFVFGLSTSAILLSLTSVPAAATVIDFHALSGVNGDPLTSYTESGFTVTNLLNFEVGKSPFMPTVPQIMAPGETSDASGDGSFSLKAADGGDFTLTSFDLYPGRELSYEIDLISRDKTSPLGISMKVLLGSGGAYNSWETLQLGAYSDTLLKEVIFSFHGRNTYAIDNAVVDEPSAHTDPETTVVPEPATWAMMLAGFGFDRRCGAPAAADRPCLRIAGAVRKGAPSRSPSCSFCLWRMSLGCAADPMTVSG